MEDDFCCCFVGEGVTTSEGERCCCGYSFLEAAVESALIMCVVFVDDSIIAMVSFLIVFLDATL